MPELRSRLGLAGIVLSLSVAGCATTEMKSSGVAPVTTPETTDVAYATQDGDVVLPDTMSLLPSSYAGSTPEGAVMAALPEPVAGQPAVEAPTAIAYAVPAVSPAQATTLADPVPLRPGEAIAAAAEPPAPVALVAPKAPSGDLDRLISKYAALYEVPEGLVRAVVRRESNFLPTAYNRGHWGLMQIKHATARGMGYAGSAKGLLDAETNLKYAVKYLRGAYLVAQGDARRADRLYQSGYYYDAKRMGLLDETGLGRDRQRRSRI